MPQLDARDYAMVAALLHQRIKPLRPIENFSDVEPFNTYRALSARLAGLFEDDDAGRGEFQPLQFISYVMTGAPQ